MFIRFIFQTILTANTIDRNGRYAFISWYSSIVGFLKTDQKLLTSRSQCMWWFGQEYILFMESFYVYTLKRISNWPPSFCYMLRKVFGEKYKQPNIGLIQFISNVSNKKIIEIWSMEQTVNMDIIKTKTAKSNHVVFNLVSILCTFTGCRIYSKVPCTHW